MFGIFDYNNITIQNINKIFALLTLLKEEELSAVGE